MSGVDDKARLKAIKTLAGNGKADRLRMAEELWRIQRGGEISLGEAAEAVGISQRRAYYLVEVWARFGRMGISRDRLARIGWTKLALLAQHRPNKIDEVDLEQAETTTVDVLKVFLTKKRPAVRTHSILLRLTPAQHSKFETALLKHGAKRPAKGRGLVGKEAALMSALGSLTQGS